MELATRASPDLQETQFTPYVTRYDASGHPILNHHALDMLQQFFLTNTLLQAQVDNFRHSLYSNMFEVILFYHKKSTHTLSKEDTILGHISTTLLGMCLNDRIDYNDYLDEIINPSHLNENENENEPSSLIKDENKPIPFEKVEIDESRIPQAVKRMNQLMQDVIATNPISHPIIALQGCLQVASGNMEGEGMETGNTCKGASLLCKNLLERLPASDRFASARRELNAVSELLEKEEVEKRVGEVIEGIYRAVLYITKETRSKELENVSYVMSAEEPFEMLMKKLLQYKPVKLNTPSM